MARNARRSTGLLPNFLFVGADKAGSSWLHAVLTHHPEMFIAPEKDLYFFDRYFDRGTAWYARHFANATRRHAVIGEICHDYLYSEAAAERIVATLPDIRIMACLREPISRAKSSYLNMQRHGWVSTDFGAALDDHPHLLDHGRYGTHLARFAALLPRDRIYLGYFDDLQSDPQGFLDGILGWLGLPPLALDGQQLRPVRRASSARNAPVARFVKAAAVVAREAHLERLVGAVKSTAVVDRLLYRPLPRDRADELSSPTIDRRIRRELAPDLQRCERQFGIDLIRRWRWDVDAPERLAAHPGV